MTRSQALIQAMQLLATRPYKAAELSKAIGINIRTTHRILSDLRASNWLTKETCKYSIQPNQTTNKNHENTHN
jgi:DNA-binding IclR family transcriptional regulator